MNQWLETRLRPTIEPMLDRGLAYYRQLAQREQRLLLVAVILLPLIVLIFGLMLPLKEHQQLLKTTLANVEQSATEAERLANLLVHNTTQGGLSSANRPILAALESAAQVHAVRKYIKRIKPIPVPGGGPQRLLVDMSEAPYAETLRFIHAMSESGINIITIKFKAVAQPGFVNVNLMLEGH